MALIKFGALAQDVRGSLNGSVFSRNRGGAYVRSKVSPLQPVSVASSSVRAMFKAIAQSWATGLTAAQRAAWIAFAAVHGFVNVFGDGIILSGIAMYEAVNQRVQLVGEPLIKDTPTTFVVADLGSVVIAFTVLAGAIAGFQITPGRALAYSEGLYVFMTPPLPLGRKVQKSDYRLINTPASGLFTSAEYLQTFAMARFGSLPWPTGKQIGILVASLNWQTGAISSAVSSVVVV